MPADLLPPTAGTTERISLLRFLWAQRDPTGFLTALTRRPGDVAHVLVGKISLALLQHPDLVQQLLVAEAPRTEKGRTLERALFFLFLGNGLLNSKGEAHRRQRRLVLPAFHRTRLAGYARSMGEAAVAAAAGWRDGEERDLGTDMMGLTLAVVGRTLFASDAPGTAQRITDAFTQLSANVNRMAFPGAVRLLKSPLPFARRIRDAERTLNEIVYMMLLFHFRFHWMTPLSLPPIKSFRKGLILL